MWRIRTLVVVALAFAGCEESRRQSPAPAPRGGHSEATGTPLPAAPSGQPRGPRVGAIASGDGVSGLSAYGGHLVFSRLEGGHYRLYHWHDGRLKALPVPARRSVFDADAGPDERGRPVVAYSDCAMRCRTFWLPLSRPGSPSELEIEGRRPSVWRGRVAYLAAGKLWLRLRGKSESQRLPLPARATVETLDLGARAAVFTWSTEDIGFGTGQGWVLQIDPLRGGTKRMVEGYISGACGFVRPLTPTAAGTGAFWIASGATCDVTKTIFAEADLRYAQPRSAAVPGRIILGATRDATSTYYLSTSGQAFQDVPDLTSCQITSCTLVRARALPWRDRTPGRPFGPHPG